MAGALKRENPDLREDVVLIRALRDSNLPKFLTEDAVLFKVLVIIIMPIYDNMLLSYRESYLICSRVSHCRSMIMDCYNLEL